MPPSGTGEIIIDEVRNPAIRAGDVLVPLVGRRLTARVAAGNDVGAYLSPTVYLIRPDTECVLNRGNAPAAVPFILLYEALSWDAGHRVLPVCARHRLPACPWYGPSAPGMARHDEQTLQRIVGNQASGRAAAQPVWRWVTTRLVGNGHAVAWLCSDCARLITGIDLVVDGGARAKNFAYAPAPADQIAGPLPLIVLDETPA